MKSTDEYTHQSVAQTVQELDVNPSRGLSKEEVQKRLKKYGYNEIEEKEEPLWHRIFRRFWGPIPWMIEAAAILSAIVQKWEDFGIIMLMLFINASLDFIQEHKALNALKALKSQMAKEVIVLRDGEFKKIQARELVPGDIMKLRIGDIIPADGQLLEGEYLLVDQSVLTGESLPVSKGVDHVVYANTVVKQGEMLAVVVNTGPRTRFQSVVSLVAQAGLEERSHFQKMVIQIGDFLIAMTVVLIFIIIMVALFRHERFLDIARFSLVLTVAAIPVALPAVLSVTMAVGALNLARKRAIVSKLVAIEELAGVDVFCCDKTGTLTKNQMEVINPVILPGYKEEDLFLLAALSSRIENQDPIEIAVFRYIEQKLPDLDWKSYRQINFIPFDPVRKRTEAEIVRNGEKFVALKGAPQVLAEMTEDENLKSTVVAKVDELASRGYRTIAVGRKRDGKPLELVGLIPLYDPPREDSKQVIQDMYDHGVEVKMITGDNVAIAREIGRILGLKQRVIRACQLKGTAKNELLELTRVLTMAIYHKLYPRVSIKEAKKFANSVMEEVHRLFDTSLLEQEFVRTHESAIIEMIESVDIFAEVVPEDKYRIVDTLQKRGHMVAMTGDGVNDAPALKKADCGIAVHNATDAARAAADIILTAPGLGVINDALKQARITFNRMKSYSIFRIAETIRVILFMTLSIVVFNFYPVTAIMIIILALLNDIPIMAIAYDNVSITRKPARWNMKEILIISLLLGVLGVISSFLLFFFLEEFAFPQKLIQAMMFLKLNVAGHLTIYIARTFERHFWQKPYPSLKLVIPAFGTTIVATLIAIYGLFMEPIGWKYGLYIWAYAIGWLIFNNFAKVGAYRFMKNRGFI